MRKLILLFIGVCLIWSLGYTETGRTYEYGSPVPRTVVTARYETAQDLTALISTIEPRALVIDKIIFSSEVANRFYFNDSNTTDLGYGPYRVPANGTIIDRDMWLKLEVGYGMYVTTLAAPCEICVEYHAE